MVLGPLIKYASYAYYLLKGCLNIYDWKNVLIICFEACCLEQKDYLKYLSTPCMLSVPPRGGGMWHLPRHGLPSLVYSYKRYAVHTSNARRHFLKPPMLSPTWPPLTFEILEEHCMLLQGAGRQQLGFTLQKRITIFLNLTNENKKTRVNENEKKPE